MSRLVRRKDPGEWSHLQHDSPAQAHQTFEHAPLVYTAFDGDDFWLAEAMVAHATAHAFLPINPETCLGYKSAVDRLGTKRDVLKADVSLLDLCDEIWVYSNIPPDEWVQGNLAEGVLVELLWYLRKCVAEDRAPAVRWVRTSEIAAANNVPALLTGLDYSALARGIGARRHEIVQLVASFEDDGIMSTALFAFEFEDSKYGEWMRAWALGQGLAPIVPTIAWNAHTVGGIEVTRSFSRRLAGVCDALVTLPRSSGNEMGIWTSELVRVAQVNHVPVQPVAWFDVGTPKAVLGTAWPVTFAEAVDLGDDSSAGGVA